MASGKRFGRVVAHIEDAQSWLARAKSDYQTANRVRAELDLCLAQAEARYAWELSRSAQAGDPAGSRARAWWTLPAACLGLVLVLLGVVFVPRLRGRPIDAGAVARRPVVASEVERPSLALEQSTALRRADSPLQGTRSGRLFAVPIDARDEEGDRVPALEESMAVATTGGQAAEEGGISTRTASAPTEGLSAASAGGLVVDLGELERESHDTLKPGTNPTEEQR